jgi:signal transduction histidine kinase
MSWAYRRGMSRRSWAFDAAIAVVVAALGVLEAFWGINATHQQGPHLAEALVYVVTGLLLLIRRVRPLGCLAAIVVVSLVEFGLFGSPEGLGVMLPATLAAYAVGRWEDRRRAWWGLVLVAVLWAVWAGFDPVTTSAPLSIVWLSPWVSAWLVGALVRTTRQATEQRRLAREQRASRAVAEERNRIARELHDVIGHSVSVMTVQVSAVRRRLTADQVAEREALESVEAVGREAMTEMRRMVGVLRETGAAADREPPPGLGQLDRMVDKFRAAGLPVELNITGEPRPLPPGLDLTAYRLVQEGLTNALRHAMSPTRVRVRIDHGDTALTILVRDDGRPGPVNEDGHGIIGMRERVSVYGGELVAGAVPDGGFQLKATLPVSTPSVIASEPSADETARVSTELRASASTGTTTGPPRPR